MNVHLKRLDVTRLTASPSHFTNSISDLPLCNGCLGERHIETEGF